MAHSTEETEFNSADTPTRKIMCFIFISLVDNMSEKMLIPTVIQEEILACKSISKEEGD